MLTGFGMDTEGALQQMVYAFTDIHIETWVTILQHDFFLKVLALFGSALEEERCDVQKEFTKVKQPTLRNARRITNLFPFGLILDQSPTDLGFLLVLEVLL